MAGRLLTGTASLRHGGQAPDRHGNIIQVWIRACHGSSSTFAGMTMKC
ncbi:MAG: hypothetical protein PHN88_12455 [Ignavibacteria bacterium]|nr:hypothetical protein [Ignavibacteria bacterium]